MLSTTAVILVDQGRLSVPKIFEKKCVKEKRLRVSEKIVVVVLLASFVYPDGEVRDSIRTNFGTSMRA
jgi:hypothetical protein